MSPSVVFFHAHPDDEAIFTGGTIVRLAADGWRTVLVVATGGEEGESSGWPASGDLAQVRRAETMRAAALLGIARVEFLGYRDSGLPGDPANRSPRAFCRADTGEVAERLGAILAEESAEALVSYDEDGIYGHPDHIMVHVAGGAAAREVGVVLYEATVDREYLHFVETHLVVEAKRAASPVDRQPAADSRLGLAAARLGMPTVLITTTVDVRAVLDVKRAAMAAHVSQIPETASPMQLPTEAFSAVYGYEWYVRHGSPGALDGLS